MMPRTTPLFWTMRYPSIVKAVVVIEGFMIKLRPLASSPAWRAHWLLVRAESQVHHEVHGHCLQRRAQRLGRHARRCAQPRAAAEQRFAGIGCARELRLELLDVHARAREHA